MEDALLGTFSSLKARTPVSRGTLSLFPLVGQGGDEGFRLLDEALEDESLRVGEVGENGSVPELRVVNGGALPVLILEGNELVGAKQNRVVNSTVLVAAESELVLPVSCVERGRWSYSSRTFSAGNGSPHPALRRLKSRAVYDSLREGLGHRSDQGAVWDEVDRVASRYSAHSETESLQDTRDQLDGSLAAFRELAMPEDARGVAVGVGGRIVMLELLAGVRSFSKTFPKLLTGYALEALDARENGVPSISDVEKLLIVAARSRCKRYEAVGMGVDVRFENEDLSGYALVSQSDILHAAVFVR